MSSRRLFLLAYGVSGAAGLLYEVAWTRLVTLQIGHTVGAVSTVLAAYMAGMALGTVVAGRRAGQLSRARGLRLYAILELIVAACAVTMPFALSAFGPLLSAAYADGTGASLFGATRVLVALACLLLPAAAMGATFPLATRWQVDDIQMAGGQVGALYAANTIGACAGALATGFVLLPALGLLRTTLVGCALNLGAGALAFLLARRASVETMPAVQSGRTGEGRRPTRGSANRVVRARTRASAVGGAAGPGRPTGEPPDAFDGGRPGLAGLALMLSGCAALVFEVAWTRVLALAIGPTSYAFSLMLATFVGGLAVGSGLATLLARRVRRPALWLALAFGIAGAGGLAALAFTGQLPLAVGRAASDPDAAFAAMLATQWRLAAALLLPLTVALGATLPFAIALARRAIETLARDVAFVYSLNTAGAVAGALLGGFALIPWLGLQGTIIVASLLALGNAALVVLVAGRGRAKALAVGALAIAAAGALSLPGWDAALMSSGGYKYAAYLGGSDPETTLRAGRIVFYRDGAAGTVSVRKLAGTTSMAIDGKVDASNGADMLTQAVLAHLPLLLHGNARDVCIIGLGSGVTLGAALAHSIARADVVEISPDVVAASAFFSRENHGALADPRTHLITGDGRSHLFLSSRRYDVIISEPSNPWMSGMSTLFTREFLRAASNRLRPGGLLCQWTHTYDMSEADLRSIVATFASVFPHGSAWLVGDEDLLLVGGAEAIEPRLRAIASGWTAPAVAAHLAEVFVREPFDLLALCMGTDAFLEAYGRGASLQTDDALALEYSAPRAIWGPRLDNVPALRTLAAQLGAPPAVAEAKAAATGAQWRTLGDMQLHAEAAVGAFESFAHAAEQDASDLEGLEGLVDAAALDGRQAEAFAFVSSLVRAHPEATAPQLALARLLAGSGRTEEALKAAEDAVARDPHDRQAREQLASVLADVQDLGRLRAVVMDMERETPDTAATSYYAATVRLLEGNVPAAAALARQAVARDPHHARALAVLAIANASLGQAQDAREAFRRALEADPRNATVYANEGLFELRSGNLEAAGRAFAEAITLDPQNDAALEGLAQVLDREGRPDRAARVRSRRSGNRQG